MHKPFHFKDFTIAHDSAAMKVGTDGVLLGAWADIDDQKTVLDIGTGTGLIALMLAQRTKLSRITGIDIDLDAFVQASENAKNSKWSDRIQMIHSEIQEFRPVTKFDFIVSNPPFFETKKNPETKRELARSTTSLSMDALLTHTSRLLQEDGLASFIIPHDIENLFLKLASDNRLFPKRITRVRGNKGAKIKRSLVELSYHQNTTFESELIIEESRHQYTKEYIELVKAFYLKM